ncbi:MAG: hypothetical protein AAF197_03980, partial [Pseudomonadota bacterium]
MYQTILNFKQARYLWVALVLSAASIVWYVLDDPIGSPNGGTWLGYTLGTIGALLIVWLMFLGIRKRSYSSNVGTVQGWTSAHVYLGTALLLLATLHTGFQFGMNVHTLAYGLMVVVIFSGFYGIYVYAKYPALIADNRAGDTLDEMLKELEKLEDRSVKDSDTPDLRQLVNSANEGCHIGGSWWHQLTAKDHSMVIVPAALDKSHLDTAERGQTVANAEQSVVIDSLANRLAELGGGAEAG